MAHFLPEHFRIKIHIFLAALIVPSHLRQYHKGHNEPSILLHDPVHCHNCVPLRRFPRSSVPPLKTSFVLTYLFMSIRLISDQIVLVEWPVSVDLF